MSVSFTDYDLSIDRAFVLRKKTAGYGIIELESDRFILVGKGFKVEWTSGDAGLPYTDMRSDLEKSVDEETGELRTERVLNGDESSGGTKVNIPNHEPDYGGMWCRLKLWRGRRSRKCACSLYRMKRPRLEMDCLRVWIYAGFLEAEESYRDL